jgi:hypothetical protein
MTEIKKVQFKLPDEVTKATGTDPRDLVLVGIPKIGKGTILGALTQTHNAVALDLEKGGYEYIDARKITVYETDLSSDWDAFQAYIKWRNLLLEDPGKYKYLVIDGLSDLDMFSVIGGTLAYMNSTVGKKFNRVRSIPNGEKISMDSPDWKEVISLPDGAGYKWTRDWFMKQIEIFRQISPYRVYAAHIVDKYIKDDGKEEVIGNEIALTGKLKRIFSSKVTALGKLVADGDKRFINFEVQNDSIIAGSRSSALQGRMLISEKVGDDVIVHWDNIFTD